MFKNNIHIINNIIIWKNNMFKLLGTFSQNAHFRGCYILFSPSDYLVSSILQWQYIQRNIFPEAFSLLTIRMPLVTKLEKVVTYRKELPPINLHGTSLEWSFKVTWEIKYISPSVKDLWTPIWTIYKKTIKIVFYKKNAFRKVFEFFKIFHLK